MHLDELVQISAHECSHDRHAVILRKRSPELLVHPPLKCNVSPDLRAFRKLTWDLSKQLDLETRCFAEEPRGRPQHKSQQRCTRSVDVPRPVPIAMAFCAQKCLFQVILLRPRATWNGVGLCLCGKR